MYSSAISTNALLRSIVIMLDTPIKVVLLIFVVLTIIFIGALIAEFVQRLSIGVKASIVIDQIKQGTDSIENIINKSKMLKVHKMILLEPARHKNLSSNMKENFSYSILENYSIEQERKLKMTELIVKLGPVFGLLGTLAPLGPGIIALSSGDTQTLSQSLLVAFDTTVVGLICAAVCTVITTIRRRWYSKDRNMLSLIMEAVLESEK